ncbi:squalene--hopene cyclase [Rubinisphaera margarita]|uniref:squalene--hopene cyclase n=1 Tax=Rubinisphaera margarita TaxID=2909586 RepID=UPI001EE869BA|nr:squalene--hopene cyclase [Rubinisphaera margarita]MCG6156407.1 squalene--hopene cyclase [Rubinisphaera margarita]
MTKTNKRAYLVLLALSLSVGMASRQAMAQLPELRSGDPLPRDVREMYDRGLKYLVETQTEAGNWSGGYSGPGTTGMALMCFLASGEDPNFGIYAGNIRRALRSMISAQDSGTGYMGNSMYHHGFAMLAFSEAYGTVDDRDLWPAGEGASQRSIGQALELAVRSAITSQKKNSYGAWRYSPGGSDADTSVAGAVLVGLLAARNAGIEVPDESVDRAIAYFVSMTAPSGQVAYSGGIGGFDESMARISIATLVYAVARRKDLPQYESTLKYLTNKLAGGSSGHGGVEYQRYYQAQALFQGDFEAWQKWNRDLIRQLQTVQQPDGSFEGSYGKETSTPLSLLALAVNYRFLPIYER